MTISPQIICYHTHNLASDQDKHQKCSIKSHWRDFTVIRWQTSFNCKICGSQQVFDCVDHEISLTKIMWYSVHSTPLRCIRSFLSNTEHYASRNQVQSTSININTCVPQWSILGPLLFLIYINDIMNSSNVLSIVLFADNRTVYVQNDSSYSEIEILNTKLAKVTLWFDSNKLTLNINKTQMIMLPQKKYVSPKWSILWNEVVATNE